MKNKNNKYWFPIVGIALSLMLTSVTASSLPQTTTPPAPMSSRGDYSGTLRLYVVEPVSRWNMYNGQPYHFGLLGFAAQTAVTIPGSTIYNHNFSWSGSFTNTNIMVIAALFNSQGHQAYAYPPSGNPFTAYYVDATAAAKPDQTGYNQVKTGFTHTVFAEEGTATWCPYCPSMGQYLDSVYESGDYPFYFAALIDDKSPGADARLAGDYNIYGFPTSFFDGGYKVLVGGQSSDSMIRNDIKACGTRAVANLNFSVALTIPSSGNLNIHVAIVNNDPATPTAPSGPTSGLVNFPYNFTAMTTDIKNSPLSYMFDWGDGTTSEWLGPFNSGVSATANHSWIHSGTFAVKVKAQDNEGHESSWSSAHTIAISFPTLDIAVAAKNGIVEVTVTNPYTQSFSHLNWNIIENGGLLGLINKNTNGSIASLQAGESTTVQSVKVFGLGGISITVVVESTTITKQGFVIGPFLFLK